MMVDPEYIYVLDLSYANGYYELKTKITLAQKLKSILIQLINDCSKKIKKQQPIRLLINSFLHTKYISINKDDNSNISDIIDDIYNKFKNRWDYGYIGKIYMYKTFMKLSKLIKNERTIVYHIGNDGSRLQNSCLDKPLYTIEFFKNTVLHFIRLENTSHYYNITNFPFGEYGTYSIPSFKVGSIIRINKVYSYRKPFIQYIDYDHNINGNTRIQILQDLKLYENDLIKEIKIIKEKISSLTDNDDIPISQSECQKYNLYDEKTILTNKLIDIGNKLILSYDEKSNINIIKYFNALGDDITKKLLDHWNKENMELGGYDEKKYPTVEKLIKIGTNLHTTFDIINKVKRNKTIMDGLISKLELNVTNVLGQIDTNINDLEKKINGIDCVSFIIKNRVYYTMSDYNGITGWININGKKYSNSCIYSTSNNELYPMIPIIGLYDDEDIRKNDTKMSNHMKVLIFWLQKVYSHIYSAKEVITPFMACIMFLIDNMYIQCSDVGEIIKKSYRMISFKIFEQKIIEDYVLSHSQSHIKSCSDKYQKYMDIIVKTPNYPKTKLDPNIVIIIMMYSIFELRIIDDDNERQYLPRKFNDIEIFINSLYKSCQRSFNKTVMKIDTHNDISITGSIKTISNVYAKMKNLIKMEINNINGEVFMYDTNVKPNYHCYITLDDTHEKGGYMFYRHTNIANTSKKCYPNYVISEDAYNHYKTTNKILRCPFCNAMIELDRLVKVGPENIICKECKEYQDNIVKTEDIDNTELHKLDSLDFNIGSKDNVIFDKCLLLSSINNKYSLLKDFRSKDFRLNKKNRQTLFNERLPTIVRNINMKNIVIAGGMCRSILLGQKIQDIDIFFVGLSKKNIGNRIIGLINDLIRNMKQESSNYKMIMAHKPKYSVIELLCVEYVEYDECDDLKNTKQKVLNEFGIACVDNDIEKEEFRKNKLIYKIQIIIKANMDIPEIFSNFDMYPSCVAFDGMNTYFTKASHIAYKYMINLINKEKASHEIIDHRIKKYFKYGFSIAIPYKYIHIEIYNDKRVKYLTISKTVFKVEGINGTNNNNLIYLISSVSNKQDNESNGLTNIFNNTTLLYTSYQGQNNNDNELSNTYDYMIKNDIKYCYIYDEITSGEIDNVVDLNNLIFQKTIRDKKYCWITKSKIKLSSFSNQSENQSKNTNEKSSG